MLLYEASNVEEPCAEKLHAGIWGQPGNWLSYLDAANQEGLFD